MESVNQSQRRNESKGFKTVKKTSNYNSQEAVKQTLDVIIVH